MWGKRDGWWILRLSGCWGEDSDHTLRGRGNPQVCRALLIFPTERSDPSALIHPRSSRNFVPSPRACYNPAEPSDHRGGPERDSAEDEPERLPTRLRSL